MIDSTHTFTARPADTDLQRYVRALLGRQQAIETLEAVEYQICQAWICLRKLADAAAASCRRTKNAIASRRAQMAQAKALYRGLQKRRQDCLDTLSQTERYAQATLLAVLTSKASFRPTGLNAALPESRHSFVDSAPAAGKNAVKKISLPRSSFHSVKKN